MELNGRHVLFKTPHGSTLYGMNHAGSDEDFYTVVAKSAPSRYGQGKAKYAKQTIVDNEDSMVVDFGTWVNMLQSGVPQAWEAAMSQVPIVDEIAAFRQSLRAGTQVFERYLRTIKSFSLSEDEGFKKKRHALRLALNLNEMAATGRFNPRLSESDIQYITDRAKHRGCEDVYGEALCIAW